MNFLSFLLWECPPCLLKSVLTSKKKKKKPWSNLPTLLFNTSFSALCHNRRYAISTSLQTTNAIEARFMSCLSLSSCYWVHSPHPTPHSVYAQWTSVNEEIMGGGVVRGEDRSEGLKRYPLQLVSQLKSSGDCFCTANPLERRRLKNIVYCRPTASWETALTMVILSFGLSYHTQPASHSAYITQEVSEVTWDYNALRPENAYLNN